MATPEGRSLPFTGPEHVDVAVLETFPYDGPVQEIVTTTDEFSAVCPYSGLPDFATLTVTYVPGKTCIELKSLKYYVTSYRNVGIYQEHATAKIAEDLYKVLAPRTITVETDYNIRGGFLTTCSVTLPAASD
ncbi:MAG: preQ(1) synthase [Gemmatimonadota bacterium]|jgi:7-cyano-7-deazaguanine reductase|nr:preQ(1) synthase [Gemmatimonadota bacterium]MDH4349075.1 preQ(1) synthase [Gemmatimonadota bacterium]